MIDPVTDIGINAVTYADHMFADATKMAGRTGATRSTTSTGRSSRSTATAGRRPTPATSSGRGRTRPSRPGRIGFGSRGRPRSGPGSAAAQFRVNGNDHGVTLPAGAGYDPATNTTTADVVVKDADLFLLSFRDTQRNQWATKDTGITQRQAPAADRAGLRHSLRTDEVFDRATKDAFSRFTTLRFLTANFNAEREWWERKQPTDAKAAFADRAGVWEYQVMLANETGKDLYITIPINASDDYVQQAGQADPLRVGRHQPVRLGRSPIRSTRA